MASAMAKEFVNGFLDELTKSDAIKKALTEVDKTLCHPYADTIIAKLQAAWSHCLNRESSAAVPEVSIIQDIVWEQLHSGDWKDVLPVWRILYSHASLLLSICCVIDGDLVEAMLQLDKALLMGCPILNGCVQKMAAAVSKEISLAEYKKSCDDSKGSCRDGHTSRGDLVAAKRPRLEGDDAKLCDASKSVGVVAGVIGNVRTPSLSGFLLDHMTKQCPVILNGCMDHWPALHKWSIDYLKSLTGPRTVPVELGLRYTDDDWHQQLMTIGQFIETYIENPVQGNPVGYLAQHPLFDQIPQLRDDITVPDYCSLTTDHTINDDDDDASDVKVNAWFGPMGTISPLHYDPEHNLLSQVVGSKYVKLYPTDQSKYLYPCDGLLSNTSQVDVENPDLKQFPHFAAASGVECTLRSGQMLYIPPKCWHYVRSLDTSFSVSFWWS